MKRILFHKTTLLLLGLFSLYAAKQVTGQNAPVRLRVNADKQVHIPPIFLYRNYNKE